MFFKNRYYGSTKNISIDNLKLLFQDKKLSYVKLAVLFGSRANDKQNSQSDYDIAILAEESIVYDWGILSKAYNDIGEILNLAEYDYDIVDLRKANNLIKNSIKQNYKILKGDDSELQRILAK